MLQTCSSYVGVPNCEVMHFHRGWVTCMRYLYNQPNIADEAYSIAA